MITVNVSSLRTNISEITNRVVFGEERVLVERNGKMVCALISLEDLKKLQALESRKDTNAAKETAKSGDLVNLGGFVTDLITELEL